MHGGTAAASGYENASIEKSVDDLTEVLGAFANLDSSTAADCSVIATLTESNVYLSKHLVEKSHSLK